MTDLAQRVGFSVYDASQHLALPWQSCDELAETTEVSAYDARRHLAGLPLAGVMTPRRQAQWRCSRLADRTVSALHERVARRLREQVRQARWL